MAESDRSGEALDEKAKIILDKTSSLASRVEQEVAWRYLRFHLQELPRRDPKAFKVLDAGCWLAEISLRLAKEGNHVTLLEPSVCLLDNVHQKVEREMPEICASLSFLNQRIEDLESCQSEGFDLIICHETIEYVDDPLRALNILTRVLRPRGLLSLVFYNRYGEVAHELLVNQDIQASLEALEKEKFQTDLSKGWGNLYSAAEMRMLLEPLGYSIEGEYALCLFCDLVSPSFLEKEENFASLVDLEERIGKELIYQGIGRFVHLVARKD